MSKKDRPKIELKKEFTVEFSPPQDGAKYIAACGWANNYVDFKKGRTKGTAIFAGGSLNILLNNEFSFSMPLEQFIIFSIAEMLKHKRKNKGLKRA